MNIDQLRESLSENAPDSWDVLASFGRKRRAARNRIYAASGGLAAAVMVVGVGVLLHSVGASTSSSSESAPAGIAAPAIPPAARAPAFGSDSGPQAGAGGAAGRAAGSAGSCGTVRLQAEMTAAVRKGASVIVGYATLTSGSAAVHGAGSDAPAYYSLTLRSVQTLAGPTVTSGSIAWIAQASPGSSASAATAQTFLPRGELFGVVMSPSAGSGVPGPVLQAAPVANGRVLLSGAACWDVTVPASGLPLDNTGENGLFPGPSTTGVPLATAEKLAAQSK